MREMDTLRKLLLLSQGRVRLFRNNVGKFWAGKAQRIVRAQNVMLYPGDVVIRQAQLVECGVGNPGGSDLVGWVSVTVTPEMAGARLAVFAAVEVKSDDGRLRPAQRTFLDVAGEMGARCGVARSVEDAEAILAGREPGNQGA